MAKSSGIDLSKLSIEELATLVKDAEAELVSRREAEKERVLQQMRELASSIGMTVEDLLKREKGKTRAPGADAKYRHPDDPNLTWSGRGKRPAWVNEALSAGKSLDELAV
ncbi:MAG TPA: H-NS histone family protein [Thermoanaerobaculia bacterium]|nr:H-NS histone family protein [Thermoanaerobaculia bacterium]